MPDEPTPTDGYQPPPLTAAERDRQARSCRFVLATAVAAPVEAVHLEAPGPNETTEQMVERPFTKAEPHLDRIASTWQELQALGSGGQG
jgi:hypothetical protein